MLAPGRPDGLDRDRALKIIGELQRGRRRDRRYEELVTQLRTLLARGRSLTAGPKVPNGRQEARCRPGPRRRRHDLLPLAYGYRLCVDC
jgi:hypothetical protein